VSILFALFILSVLIFVHELGHFLAARFFGVHVEVFSIGFGKRILTRKWGATEFSLAIIPLGGYVRMKGQDDIDPTKRVYAPDSYNSLSPYRRIAILLAGPLFNFLMAFALFVMLNFIGHETLGTKIKSVTPDSPAMLAQLQEGDIIVTVDGIAVRDFATMREAIISSASSVTLDVLREGSVQIFTLTPRLTDTTSMYNEPIQQPMIGIHMDGNYTVFVDHSVIDSIILAGVQTYNAAFMILEGLQKLIEGIVPAKELGGVISIVDITSQASSQGNFLFVFFITAMISVNLGVLNLLPIPALDGGHIMFNLYELIARRAPSPNVMLNITIAGWVLLLSLMALGLYNDINRLLDRLGTPW